eukprot:GHRR01033504.1.p1 GENE.GHRR01033504.1~~GHRR01033504.1.p1  ORF type:complete len:440 (+),score=169.37 GHRR01033504.1:313-1632(+)
MVAASRIHLPAPQTCLPTARAATPSRWAIGRVISHLQHLHQYRRLRCCCLCLKALPCVHLGLIQRKPHSVHAHMWANTIGDAYWLQHPDALKELLWLLLQEIQACCKPDMLPPSTASRVLQLFWDCKSQRAAAEASAAAARHGAVAQRAPHGGSARHDLPQPAAAVAAAAQRAVAGQGAAAPGSQAAGLAIGLAAVSRYRSDFQEMTALGRGGFGVVVAAINRLDGRRYAVKKIRLESGGGSGSYSRILREVATLSRLQHPNVVRYFQAWTEASFDSVESSLLEGSEGGEWGTLTDDDGHDTDEDTGNEVSTAYDTSTTQAPSTQPYTDMSESLASQNVSASITQSSRNQRQWLAPFDDSSTTATSTSNPSSSASDASAADSATVSDITGRSSVHQPIHADVSFSIAPRLPGLQDRLLADNAAAGVGADDLPRQSKVWI